MITRLCKLLGKMQLLTQNGREKDYQQKRNGNLLRVGERQAIFMHGEINLSQMANGWPILSKESFPNETKVLMGLQELRQLNNMQLILMGCMILPATFGNGAVTGTGPITISFWRTKKKQ